MPVLSTAGSISARGFGFAAKASAVYVENVFSTYLYTGTGSSQTITNSIDLSTKGGMVWLKDRKAANPANPAFIQDTVLGTSSTLQPSTTGAAGAISTSVTAFNTNGFSIGTNLNINTNGNSYVSWTYRKQPKFFDCLTYSGTGVAQTISHNLGATPGMIIVKRTDAAASWFVYHKGLTDASYFVILNSNAAAGSIGAIWNNTAPTSSVFSVGANTNVNASGGTYVAYLFADQAGGFGNAGTDSVVACGNYTGNGASTGPTVTLGWEPQFVMVKMSSSTGDWNIFDNMRGILTGNADPYLFANTSAAEATINGDLIDLTPTGFTIKNNNAQVNTLSGDYIYLAIRRGPMKTPTDATKVFTPLAVSNTTGTINTTGFPIDMQLSNYRLGSAADSYSNDRMRGFSSTTTESGVTIVTSSTSAESTSLPFTLNWSMTGFSTPSYWTGSSMIYWNFRRAPGFFDIVCYSGGGTTTINRNHNLTVAPELIIWKCRNAAVTWPVWCKYTGSSSNTSNAVFLNTTAAFTNEGFQLINVTLPTSTIFTTWSNAYNNASGNTYVAYLFATCPGVSKVGSYTGTGAAQNIDCGFSAAARFILIKRTDSIGDWYVYDSSRGISSGNDPYIFLNTTAAEVTSTNYVDAFATGFSLTATAPGGLNANGGSYIFLAIA